MRGLRRTNAILTGASLWIGRYINAGIDVVHHFDETHESDVVDTPRLVVLANVFPSVTPKLLRWIGYADTFERVIAAGIDQ